MVTSCNRFCRLVSADLFFSLSSEAGDVEKDWICGAMPHRDEAAAGLETLWSRVVAAWRPVVDELIVDKNYEGTSMGEWSCVKCEWEWEWLSSRPATDTRGGFFWETLN